MSKSIGYFFISKTKAVLRRIQKVLDFRLDAYKYSYTKRDIEARVSRIGGGYRGSTREYDEKVLQYWKKYGVKPKKIWYALYCDGDKEYDPRYIPDSIWFKDILPFFNNYSMSNAYADKGIYSYILKDVKKPETIVKNIAGYFYNGDADELITRDEAEKICEKENHLICKPSLGTKGEKIQFYDRENKDTLSISSIFNIMDKNFVVQRIVKQHPELERLNPTSLNTVRVISFHFKEEVHILSALLRMGSNGSRVDNVSAGGCACAIKPDGWLYDKSVNRKSTWTDETETGIKLNTIHIPNYDEIVNTIKRLHCQLPYFNIIGWDFAVDEEGTPIFVEFNTKPGQNQIGGKKPTFGDLTDQVLEEVFIKKTLK